MTKLLDTYLNINGSSRYKISTLTNISQNTLAFSAEKEHVPDLSLKTLVAVADALKTPLQQVINDLLAIEHPHSCSLNQLKRQVLNYLDQNPGTTVKDYQEFDTYFSVSFTYYVAQTNKKHSVNVTGRIYDEYRWRISNERAGQAFFPNNISSDYQGDTAVASMLDHIIMKSLPA